MLTAISEVAVKSSVLFRVSAILILLFALGHTFGFRQIDPAWHIDDLIGSLRSTKFQAAGFERSYWDFYAGFGFFVSVFLVFAAVVAWQFSRFAQPLPAPVRTISWALAISFGLTTVLGWRYFFAIPIGFSALICVCLSLAAASSR